MGTERGVSKAYLGKGEQQGAHLGSNESSTGKLEAIWEKVEWQVPRKFCTNWGMEGSGKKWSKEISGTGGRRGRQTSWVVRSRKKGVRVAKRRKPKMLLKK